MGRFVKGDIAVVPFPFFDLTQAKRRPALVLAELDGDDRILCQITSQQVRVRYAIELDDSDLEEGALRQKSTNGNMGSTAVSLENFRVFLLCCFRDEKSAHQVLLKARREPDGPILFTVNAIRT